MMGIPGDESMRSIMQEMLTSIPGIDEAMGFSELIKEVQTMNYSVIVFDTAPTGHTMRLLNFPSLLEKGLTQIANLRQNIGTALTQFASMMGRQENAAEAINTAFQRMETMKGLIEQVNRQFQDPKLTTFLAVCIPEFLSVYETERLVQELFKFQIEIGHIVINQVLFSQDECRMCVARKRMQKKYIEQVYEIYSDFHVVVAPQLEEEVRGLEKIQQFSRFLMTPP